MAVGLTAITGDSTANIIEGGAGADTLTGGGGNDTLYGYFSASGFGMSDGNDTLYGGAGNATLVMPGVVTLSWPVELGLILLTGLTVAPRLGPESTITEVEQPGLDTIVLRVGDGGKHISRTQTQSPTLPMVVMCWVWIMACNTQILLLLKVVAIQLSPSLQAQNISQS